jgi:hypothetical protein
LLKVALCCYMLHDLPQNKGRGTNPDFWYA